jgi:hypothetical protein
LGGFFQLLDSFLQPCHCGQEISLKRRPGVGVALSEQQVFAGAERGRPKRAVLGNGGGDLGQSRHAMGLKHGGKDQPDQSQPNHTTGQDQHAAAGMLRILPVFLALFGQGLFQRFQPLGQGLGIGAELLARFVAGLLDGLQGHV